MKLFSFFALPLSVLSFSRITQITPKINTPVIRGATPPLEFFDPLNFSKDQTRITYMREAELKHSRIAMVAATLIPFTELFTHKSSIHAFDDLPIQGQITILTLMFASEFNSMLRGWKNPYTNSFELNDDYQPGDLGFSFDLDFNDEKNAVLLDREINNGRLAMFASLGMIAQELVTNKPLF
jgi:hypothetical protein